MSAAKTTTPKVDPFVEQIAAFQGAATQTLAPGFDKVMAHRAAVSALQTHINTIGKAEDKKPFEAALKGVQEKFGKLASAENLEKIDLDPLKAAAHAQAKTIGNAALAEGLMVRGMGKAANAPHAGAYDVDAVKALLGDHAHILENDAVGNAAKSAAEKAAGEQMQQTFNRSVNQQIAQTVANPAPEKSWVSRMGKQASREVDMITSRVSHGLDARTGEKVPLAKTKVALGVAVAGVGLVDGARRIYNGIAGDVNPETGKNERDFSSALLGVGELAALATLGRRMATGQFIGR